jgi:acylphosphatase
MAEDLASVNILVIGLVQGVFYRASTLEQAQRLGLTGWVKNLAGGNEVEIVAEGPRYALEQLVDWAKQGPPDARIDDCIARYGPYRGEFRTFMIVR